MSAPTPSPVVSNGVPCCRRSCPCFSVWGGSENVCTFGERWTGARLDEACLPAIREMSAKLAKMPGQIARLRALVRYLLNRAEWPEHVLGVRVDVAREGFHGEAEARLALVDMMEEFGANDEP